MQKPLKALFISIAALACGLAICVPGICGCAQVIRGVDTSGFAFIGFALDLLGLTGIAASIIAMPIAHLRKLTAERESRNNL